MDVGGIGFMSARRDGSCDLAHTRQGKYEWSQSFLNYHHNSMTQAQEQDEVLWAQFIDESIESDCVYMLVDADTNYAVLTPE
jgi:hypothetical protein